ncbi:hypothetical protein VP1G_03998 [Cytospora mali]|uniref:SMP-30/Gluconolactonase/LRE-like region domain-containing protein n=1 Tax=Cytospora mali TaxID=578113 RepID=A0A194UYI2_CYTMA|nr:hypothetical protein VP1G_03998 [Valsa mali var. pyri (nom. inval.)]
MVDIEDIHLVTQLPQTGWFEGFALRPNGHILVSRLDEPILYTFDAEDQEADPQELHTFSNATGLINLCPLHGRHDEYAVITGRPDIDAMVFDNRDYSVFRNRICALDIATGVSSVLVEDDSMKAVEGEPFGLNRLRIAEGFVWFTNTSAGTLSRFPISIDGPGIKATGPVQILCEDIEHCDGLAVAEDASAVWTASMANGWLWQVDIDKEGDEVFATTLVIKEDMYSPTAVELAYANGKPRLYVVCNGEREKEQAWIKKDGSNPWTEFQNVTKSVEVSISVDE